MVGLAPAPKEEEIITNMKEDTIYTGPGDNKFIQIVWNEDEDNSNTEIEISPNVKLHFKIYHTNQSDSGIKNIHITKRKRLSKAQDYQQTETISLSPKGIDKIRNLLELLLSIKISDLSAGKISLRDNEDIEPLIKQIKSVAGTKEGMFAILEALKQIPFSENDVLKTLDILGSSGINFIELAELKNKKDGLATFKRLLSEVGYLAVYKTEQSIIKGGDESARQYFFEKNTWIFGYSLGYIWCEKFSEKLETTTTGNSISGAGKRIDGFMYSEGSIHNLVFVEVKTPGAQLLGKEYRPECRVPGEDLIGGILQIQTTIKKFKKENYEKIEQENIEGDKTGIVAYNHKPKSVLIVGDLSSFRNENGINEKKYSCFQLFRESIQGIEIITFDELYKRAESIIKNSKIEKDKLENNNPSIDDIFKVV